MSENTPLSSKPSCDCNAYRVLQELCEEWNESCEPGCDKLGHDELCASVSITQAMRKRREEIERLRSVGMDVIDAHEKEAASLRLQIHALTNANKSLADRMDGQPPNRHTADEPDDDRACARLDLAYKNGAQQALAIAHQDLKAADRWLATLNENCTDARRILAEARASEPPAALPHLQNWLPAREFNGELWVKAADHSRELAKVRAAVPPSVDQKTCAHEWTDVARCLVCDLTYDMYEREPETKSEPLPGGVPLDEFVAQMRADETDGGRDG